MVLPFPESKDRIYEWQGTKKKAIVVKFQNNITKDGEKQCNLEMNKNEINVEWALKTVGSLKNWNPPQNHKHS